jgi:hypothetical protein
MVEYQGKSARCGIIFAAQLIRPTDSNIGRIFACSEKNRTLSDLADWLLLCLA